MEVENQINQDIELINQTLAGDFNSFETLVSKYEGRVYSTSMRMLRQREDAEDVVQETFLAVLENLSKFRRESSFYTWLMRIATNKALKTIRKKKNQRSDSLEEKVEEDLYGNIPLPDYIAQWEKSPKEIAADKQTEDILTKAFDGLEEKYRMVFILRDVEGFSVRETSEILDISEANVKVRLLRARLMLREKLTRVYGDEAHRVFSDHNHEH